METAELPLLILAWCSLLYGVIELINALKIHSIKKAADLQRDALNRQQEDEPIAEEISSEINREPVDTDTVSDKEDYPDFVG